MLSQRGPDANPGVHDMGNFSQQRGTPEHLGISKVILLAQRSLEMGDFFLASEKFATALTAFNNLNSKTEQEVLQGAQLWRQYAQAKIMAQVMAGAPSFPEVFSDINSPELLTALRPDDALLRLKCWEVHDFKLSYLIGLAQGVAELLQHGYSDNSALHGLGAFLFGRREEKDALLAKYNDVLKNLAGDIAEAKFTDFSLKWDGLQALINNKLGQKIIEVADKAKCYRSISASGAKIDKAKIDEQIEQYLAEKLNENRQRILQGNLPEIKSWLTTMLANGLGNEMGNADTTHLTGIFQVIETFYSKVPRLLSGFAHACHSAQVKNLSTAWTMAIFGMDSLANESNFINEHIKYTELYLNGLNTNNFTYLTELRIKLAELRYYRQSQELKSEIQELQSKYELLGELYLDLGRLLASDDGARGLVPPRSLVLCSFDSFMISQELVNLNILPIGSEIQKRNGFLNIINKFRVDNESSLQGKLPPHVVKFVETLT